MSVCVWKEGEGERERELSLKLHITFTPPKVSYQKKPVLQYWQVSTKLNKAGFNANQQIP